MLMITESTSTLIQTGLRSAAAVHAALPRPLVGVAVLVAAGWSEDDARMEVVRGLLEADCLGGGLDAVLVQDAFDSGDPSLLPHIVARTGSATQTAAYRAAITHLDSGDSTVRVAVLGSVVARVWNPGSGAFWPLLSISVDVEPPGTHVIPVQVAADLAADGHLVENGVGVDGVRVFALAR